MSIYIHDHQKLCISSSMHTFIQLISLKHPVPGLMLGSSKMQNSSTRVEVLNSHKMYAKKGSYVQDQEFQ